MDNKNKILFLNATSYFGNATENRVRNSIFDQLMYMINSEDENFIKKRNMIVFENSLHSYTLAQRLNQKLNTIQCRSFPLKVNIETFSEKVSPIASQIYVVDNLSQGYPVTDDIYPQYKSFDFRELWRLRCTSKIHPMYVVGRNKLINIDFEGREELSDIFFNPQIAVPDTHDYSTLDKMPLHKAKVFERYRG